MRHLPKEEEEEEERGTLPSKELSSQDGFVFHFSQVFIYSARVWYGESCGISSCSTSSFDGLVSFHFNAS